MVLRTEVQKTLFFNKAFNTVPHGKLLLKLKKRHWCNFATSHLAVKKAGRCSTKFKSRTAEEFTCPLSTA